MLLSIIALCACTDIVASIMLDSNTLSSNASSLSVLAIKSIFKSSNELPSNIIFIAFKILNISLLLITLITSSSLLGLLKEST